LHCHLEQESAILICVKAGKSGQCAARPPRWSETDVANNSADKRVTLTDVAKLAGVSKQTVSRVINDSEHVTDETRIKVQQCIEVLGFRPSALARQLSSGRSYTIGVVSCGGLGYLVSGVAYVGMVRQADKMGYALLIKELTDFSPGSVRTMLDYLIERQVDGLIWAGPEMGDSHVWLNDFDLDSLPTVSYTHLTLPTIYSV